MLSGKNYLICRSVVALFMAIMALQGTAWAFPDDEFDSLSPAVWTKVTQSFPPNTSVLACENGIFRTEVESKSASLNLATGYIENTYSMTVEPWVGYARAKFTSTAPDVGSISLGFNFETGDSGLAGYLRFRNKSGCTLFYSQGENEVQGPTLFQNVWYEFKFAWSETKLMAWYRQSGNQQWLGDGESGFVLYSSPTGHPTKMQIGQPWIGKSAMGSKSILYVDSLASEDYAPDSRSLPQDTFAGTEFDAARWTYVENEYSGTSASATVVDEAAVVTNYFSGSYGPATRLRSVGFLEYRDRLPEGPWTLYARFQFDSDNVGATNSAPGRGTNMGFTFETTNDKPVYFELYPKNGMQIHYSKRDGTDATGANLYRKTWYQVRFTYNGSVLLADYRMEGDTGWQGRYELLNSAAITPERFRIGQTTAGSLTSDTATNTLTVDDLSLTEGPVAVKELPEDEFSYSAFDTNLWNVYRQEYMGTTVAVETDGRGHGRISHYFPDNYGVTARLLSQGFISPKKQLPDAPWVFHAEVNYSSSTANADGWLTQARGAMLGFAFDMTGGERAYLYFRNDNGMQVYHSASGSGTGTDYLHANVWYEFRFRYANNELLADYREKGNTEWKGGYRLFSSPTSRPERLRIGQPDIVTETSRTATTTLLLDKLSLTESEQSDEALNEDAFSETVLDSTIWQPATNVFEGTGATVETDGEGNLRITNRFDGSYGAKPRYIAQGYAETLDRLPTTPWTFYTRVKYNSTAIGSDSSAFRGGLMGFQFEMNNGETARFYIRNDYGMQIYRSVAGGADQPEAALYKSIWYDIRFQFTAFGELRADYRRSGDSEWKGDYRLYYSEDAVPERMRIGQSEIKSTTSDSVTHTLWVDGISLAEGSVEPQSLTGDEFSYSQIDTDVWNVVANYVQDNGTSASVNTDGNGSLWIKNYFYGSYGTASRHVAQGFLEPLDRLPEEPWQIHTRLKYKSDQVGIRGGYLGFAFDMADGTRARFYLCNTSGGQILYSNAGNDYTPGIKFWQNYWHDLSFVYDGTTIKAVWDNGAASYEIFSSTTTWPERLKIGQSDIALVTSGTVNHELLVDGIFLEPLAPESVQLPSDEFPGTISSNKWEIVANAFGSSVGTIQNDGSANLKISTSFNGSYSRNQLAQAFVRWGKRLPETPWSFNSSFSFSSNNTTTNNTGSMGYYFGGGSLFSGIAVTKTTQGVQLSYMNEAGVWTNAAMLTADKFYDVVFSYDVGNLWATYRETGTTTWSDPLYLYLGASTPEQLFIGQTTITDFYSAAAITETFRVSHVLPADTMPPEHDPVISVLPAAGLDFGELEAGSSKTLDFTLFNDGGGTLTGLMSVADPGGVYFVQANSYSLGARQSMTLPVTFTPKASQLYDTTATFTGTGLSDVTVNIKAKGLGAPTLSVEPVVDTDFGEVDINTCSTEKQFLVSNAGEGKLSGTATIAPPGPFSVTSGGTYTNLETGQSHIVKVKFCPTQATENQSAVVTFTGAGGTTRVLKGSGSTPPTMMLSTMALDYHAISLGEYSDLTVTVTNTGGRTLVNGTATIAPGSGFSLISNPTFSVEPGSPMVFTIRFSPTEERHYTGTLTFAAPGLGNRTCSLDGDGRGLGIIKATPGRKDFGMVGVSGFAEQDFVVENIASTGLLKGDARVTGNNVFSIVVALPGDTHYELGPGETKTIKVRFAPMATQNYSGTVQFSGGGGTSCPLTGSGAAYIHDCSFTIERDYNQPVAFPVINWDGTAHNMMIELEGETPNGLVAGFTARGSKDTGFTPLAPGANWDARLMLHAPDAIQTDYTLKAKLRVARDAGGEDAFFANINVHVNVPDMLFDFDEVPALKDKASMTRVLRVTNHGANLTDLRVYADEALSDLILFQPHVEHGAVASGTCLDIKVVPNLLTLIQNESHATSGLIYATAGGLTRQVQLDFGCDDGMQLFTGTLTGQMITAKIHDSGCTNRGRIVANFNLPAGVAPQNVDKSTLAVNFDPRSGWVHRPYSIQIFINDTPIFARDEMIPSGPYEFDIPTQALTIPDTGVAKNEIRMEFQNLNPGHYTIATDLQVFIAVDTVEVGVCAENQEMANQYANRLGYFSPQPTSWDLSEVTALDRYDQPIADCGEAGLGEVVTVEARTTDTTVPMYVVAQPDNGEPAFMLNWIAPGLYRGSWIPKLMPDGDGQCNIAVYGGACHNGSSSVCVKIVPGQLYPDFEADPRQGTAPLLVQFSDKTRNGPAVAWSWYFGDPNSGTANTSTLQNPQHRYTTPGKYTITLTVENQSGTETITRRDFVVAGAPPQTHLTLPTELVEVGPAGGSATFSVRNTGAGVMYWSAVIVDGADWIRIISGGNGEQSGMISVRVADNVSTLARTAHLQVFASGADNSPTTLTITQPGQTNVPSLSVTPGNQYVGEEGGMTYFNVRNAGGGTLQWSAQLGEGAPWAQITAGESGTGDGMIGVYVQPETAGIERQVAVRITANSANSPVTVVLSQNGMIADEGEPPEGDIEGTPPQEGILPEGGIEGQTPLEGEQTEGQIEGDVEGAPPEGELEGQTPLEGEVSGLEIIGKVQYRLMRNAGFKAAANLMVEAYLSGSSAPVAYGYTLADGALQIVCSENVAIRSGSQISLRVYAESMAVRISYPAGANDTPYVYQSATRTVTTNPLLDFTTVTISGTQATPNHAEAFGIAGEIENMRVWLANLTKTVDLPLGWSRSKVAVQYPAPQTTPYNTYDPLLDKIRLIESWSEGCAHQYAHAIQRELYGTSLLMESDNSANVVSAESPAPSAPEKAFSEGWATFFEYAYKDQSLEYDWVNGVPFWMGLDATQYVNANGNYGNVVQGAVASVLWDIMDGGAQDDDGFNARFADAWTTFVASRPTSLWKSDAEAAELSVPTDFYHQWKQTFPMTAEQSAAFNAIFLDQGMPVADDSMDARSGNDSSATAYPLGSITSRYTSSGLICADPDWYRFTIGGAGSEADASACVTFNGRTGALTLDVFDLTTMQSVGNAIGAGANLCLDFTGVPGKDYVVHVTGMGDDPVSVTSVYEGDYNPNYALTIQTSVTPAEGEPPLEGQNPQEGERDGETPAGVEGETDTPAPTNNTSGGCFG